MTSLFSRRLPCCLPLAVALAFTAAAQAGAAAPGGMHKQHVREGLHVEHLRLASVRGDEEDAVFYGATLAWFVNEHWFWGGSAYGAALGRRGGFFIGGLRVGRRLAVGGRGSIDVSMVVGGGGGGAADQGDGLFVRPEVSAGYRISPAWELAAHAAYVRFRHSGISSPVFGGGLSYHYMRLFGGAGEP